MLRSFLQDIPRSTSLGPRSFIVPFKLREVVVVDVIPIALWFEGIYETFRVGFMHSQYSEKISGTNATYWRFRETPIT